MPNKNHIAIKHISLSIAKACSLLVFLLGTLTVYGWVAHFRFMIQLFHSFVPMSFNTAFCLMFCGIGLYAAIYNRKFISFLSGLSVCLISCFSIYLHSLYYNNLAYNDYEVANSLFAKQMPLITALGLLFSSFLLFSISLQRRRLKILCTRLTASIVLIFGIVPFAGHISGIEEAYSLGHLTPMSSQTAVAFIMIGLSALAYAWQFPLRVKGVIHAIWLASCTTLIAFLYTLAVWHQNIHEEKALTYAKIQEEANDVQQNISNQVTNSVFALRRMAQRWEIRGETPKNEWEMDADNYLHDFSSLSAVEWIDSSYKVQWIVPMRGNEHKIGMLAYFNPEYRRVFENASYILPIYLSKIINLDQQNKGFIAYIPINENQKFKGFVAGVYNLQKLIDKNFPFHKNNKYQIRLIDDDGLIYSSSSHKAFNTDSVHSIFNLFNRKWELILQPSQHYVNEQMTNLPRLELIGGTLISLLMGIAVFYTITSFQRSKELKKQLSEIQLLESERSRLVALINESPDYIGVADLSERLLYHNLGAKKIVGIPADFDMSQLKVSDVHPDWAYQFIRERAIPMVLKQGSWTGETALLHQQTGQEIPMLQTITLHRDEQNNPSYLTTIMRDITDIKLAEQELKYIAYHDVLTGLANRKQLDASFKLALALAKRHKAHIAVMFMDLDQFKQVNDNYGHEIGDLLLVEIADRLKSSVRESDILVRLGGDEFIVVLTEIKNVDQSVLVAKKILKNIEKPMHIEEKTINITASIGISIYPQDDLDLKNLLKFADQALYRVKSEGKNNYKFFSETKIC